MFSRATTQQLPGPKMISTFRILAMLAISIAAGATQRAITGHPWVPDRKKVEDTNTKRGELEKRQDELRKTIGVTLEEFQRGIAEGAIVFDARPASEFEKAHLALDGPIPVLNVEPDKVNQNLDRILPFQGQPILIYCTSPTCELGEELYLELEKAQFFGMKIYFPGWEGLSKAGVKTTTGPDRWTLADTQAALGQPTENAQPPPEAQQPAENP